MPLGPFGEALMRMSRTPVPVGNGARYGMAAPNSQAVAMAQPSPIPGMMPRPSQMSSQAQLPPQIQAMLGVLTGRGAAGASSPVPPMGMPVAPPVIPQAGAVLPPGPGPGEQPGMPPEMAAGGSPPPVAPPPQESPPTPPVTPDFSAPSLDASKAERIRAPRDPEVDAETFAIVAPGQSWRDAFYAKNNRYPNVSDYESKAFVADYVKRTGVLPTKAEWLMRRFPFQQEPSGISEFA